MTRKDYVMLAKVMFETKPTAMYPEHPIEAWTDVMRHLTARLAHDNPKFDRSKFIAAANGK